MRGAFTRVIVKKVRGRGGEILLKENQSERGVRSGERRGVYESNHPTTKEKGGKRLKTDRFEKMRLRYEYCHAGR